jgi:hypothetical protein
MRRHFAGLLLVACIGMSSCSAINRSNLYKDPDSWTDGRISAVSMGGAVVLGNPDQDLIVILDNEYLPTTRDVVVSATELYLSYLIETSDPAGRFLPSIRVVNKEPRPLLRVESLQTEKSSRWKINPLGELEILPLTHTSLGMTSLKDLPNLLLQYVGPGDVNVLLPVGGTFIDNEEYEAFQTLGSLTVILLPHNFTSSGGSGLTAPAIIEGIPWFSISTDVLTLQSTAISEMIHSASSPGLF